MESISIGTAGIVVALGMGVVFFGLILLMFVVKIMSSIIMRSEKKTETVKKEERTERAVAPAPGTAGDLKLYDTDPRDAALIMAIVANKMGRPLNELRFRSIREIKQESSGSKTGVHTEMN